MISVIIPAHNEEKVIATTIKPLLPGTLKGEMEIIVVCNGCTDNTAGVVSLFKSSVKCLETSVPSKTNALNLGDEVASGFPRIYLDADVVISLETVMQLANALLSDELLAVSPTMRMDFQKSSWLVRSYYEVWQQLPYVREGMIGTGVYALSEKGRGRFDKFPRIIADDGYIRALFNSNERTCLDCCYSSVRAPANLEGLLKIKTRSRLGGYELKIKYPELSSNEKKDYGKAILELLKYVHLWIKIPVYLYINLRVRLRAKKYVTRHGFSGWERDESSR